MLFRSVGEWIYDKHERPFDCLTHFVLEIGDFVDGVKQKTLFFMSRKMMQQEPRMFPNANLQINFGWQRLLEVCN